MEVDLSDEWWAALERDAMRYRWLRDNLSRDTGRPFIAAYAGGGEGGAGGGAGPGDYSHLVREDADAWVDRSMEATDGRPRRD